LDLGRKKPVTLFNLQFNLNQAIRIDESTPL
jgi:hypothetical protein